MARMVLGVFSEPVEADKAVDELKDAGFKKEDISVIMREGGAVPAKGGRGATVAREAAAGITTGGAIGGIAGLIIGIAAVTVPGIGALFAAGPLALALGLGGVGVTTLAGAITGAAAGGIIGGLVGLGVPQKKAEIYEEAVRKGQVLLAVSTTDETNEAKANEIFKKHGALEVCTIEGKK